jgi:hypothetical protein
LFAVAHILIKRNEDMSSTELQFDSKKLYRILEVLFHVGPFDSEEWDPSEYFPMDSLALSFREKKISLCIN